MIDEKTMSNVLAGTAELATNYVALHEAAKKALHDLHASEGLVCRDSFDAAAPMFELKHPSIPELEKALTAMEPPKT